MRRFDDTVGLDLRLVEHLLEAISSFRCVFTLLDEIRERVTGGWIKIGICVSRRLGLLREWRA